MVRIYEVEIFSDAGEQSSGLGPQTQSGVMLPFTYSLRGFMALITSKMVWQSDHPVCSAGMMLSSVKVLSTFLPGFQLEDINPTVMD